jgi:hypothetical protein
MSPILPPARTRSVSELGELGIWRDDSFLPRAEVDEHGGLILDTDDPAEAVTVVSHLVLHIEYFDGRGRRGCVEGTTWQMAPGHGAGWLHYY